MLAETNRIASGCINKPVLSASSNRRKRFSLSNYLIANTSVESFRSTTSGRYISITEKERIIDDLVLESLRDITKESEKLITEYMKLSAYSVGISDLIADSTTNQKTSLSQKKSRYKKSC